MLHKLRVTAQRSISLFNREDTTYSHKTQMPIYELWEPFIVPYRVVCANLHMCLLYPFSPALRAPAIATRCGLHEYFTVVQRALAVVRRGPTPTPPSMEGLYRHRDLYTLNTTQAQNVHFPSKVSIFLSKRVNLLRKQVTLSSSLLSTFSVQDEYKIYWLLITDYLRVYRSMAVTPMVISALHNVYLGRSNQLISNQ